MTPYKYVGRVASTHMVWEVTGPDGKVAAFQGNLARERAGALVTILNRAFELGVSKFLQREAAGGK